MSALSVIGSVKKVARNPGFWFILVLLALITLPHYSEALKHPAFFTQIMQNIGVTRHAAERILYLAPIIWASFVLGWKGGLATSLAAGLLMLPRVFLYSKEPKDAFFEIVAVFIMGNLVSFSFEALRRERERRTQLEAAQRELETNLRVIQENERHLAALNQVSSAVSQSLDLNRILSDAISQVREVMQVESALVFLLQDEAGELILTEYRGVSPRAASAVARLRLGEGFNGRVAQTGEAMYVEDASHDPRLTKAEVREEGVRSQLIVPMKSKGRVVGTLCVATRSHRRFPPNEVELLTAIANQVGVAVENARLYQQERKTAEELRVSEERYRQLFENAHDAIWLHDLGGRIVAANNACTRLTGYSLAELYEIKASDLLALESRATAWKIEAELLRGETTGRHCEVRMMRKDGAEAFVQLGISLVSRNGQPVAIQHIARDVTEEKRMQENLRFYLQQVTQAQEEERKRIARELHDETAQALVVLARQIDALASGDKRLSKQSRLGLEELQRETATILEGVRRFSQDLRPSILDHLGLLPALEWLTTELEKYSGISTRCIVLGTTRRLPEEMEMVLFRIAQEGLRNVGRHSQAKHAEVVVEFSQGQTKLTITDDGKGFELPHTVGDLARTGRLGLAGMQERARLLGGTLEVHSEPGRGTTITVVAPA